jgi:glucokinase
MRALGIDLGGTKLLACLTAEDGTVLARTVRATGRGTGPFQARALIVDAANELRRTGGRFDVAGVGFPGQVDFYRGFVGGSVMLDGWSDVALSKIVADALIVPCAVDNDVNCAAIAELRARGDEAPSSMLFVAVGTGIGGAITIGRQLWRGHTGVAGEIGNVTIDRHGPTCWCGRRGCLNTFASGSAIERQLREAGLLAEHRSSTDPEVLRVLDEAATALGIGIANALNLLNPEVVVFGGGVAQVGERWLETVARTARAEAFPEAGRCRFEPAWAGYEAGAVGAALLAEETFQGLTDQQLAATTSASPAVPGAPAARDSRTPSGVPRLVR